MLSPKIGNTERKPRLIQGSTETSSHCYKAKTKKKKKRKKRRIKEGERKEKLYRLERKLSLFVNI